MRCRETKTYEANTTSQELRHRFVQVANRVWGRRHCPSVIQCSIRCGQTGVEAEGSGVGTGGLEAVRACLAHLGIGVL